VILDRSIDISTAEEQNKFGLYLFNCDCISYIAIISSEAILTFKKHAPISG